ncbi:MAG: glycosyltransferase family 2 protein [Patescibacteria group bacterium]|nr:glycosyltransferase family 2 protein [Patescibacteria group bacterium]
MNKNSVSVIIPNYNGKHLLKKHLPSVIKASKNNLNMIKEIIVVDDCSTDDSVAYIKEKYPQVKIFRHSKNRGFSFAVNTGVKNSRCSLVVLLNNDVSVSENFVFPTLKHFEDISVFGVSFHERGYGPAIGSFENGYFVHKGLDELKETTKTMWVSGGSGVFRRSYYLKLSGMDANLFSPFYWEDVDLSYRAWKRGYKCLWEPKAIVSHIHEGTTRAIDKKFKMRIQERNHLIFMWKNITSKSLMKKHIFGLINRSLLHPGYIVVVIMALTKIGLIASFRRKEKKHIKLSDEAVLAMFS